MNSTETTYTLKIGTRTSKLALWQTHHIIKRLQEAWPSLECHVEHIVTKGDKTLDKALPEIGGKGLFTAELESALRNGEIDIAIHSLKDLPVEDAPGLTLGAITSRADVRDGLVARNGWTLDSLPQGAVVGTSSVRRQAQLLAQRPDLQVRPIRGNVDTRIRKVKAGEYDAAILAAAGMKRLGLTDMVTEWLDLKLMLPAPGQGALAVQCRAGDERTMALLEAVNDPDVRRAITAERAFLNGLGGGCSAPVGAHATILDSQIQLEALIGWPDGKEIYRLSGSGDDAWKLGMSLAQQAISQGAGAILESLAVDRGPKPLQGRRIVVTRAQAQAGVLSRKLASLGATPIEVPMIEIAPLLDSEAIEQAIHSLEYYDWVIFTSVNGVEMFWDLMSRSGLSLANNKVATVGPATAGALIERGVQPDFTPEEFVGEAVAAGMGELSGCRILLPRAKIGRKELPELLRSRGAVVDDVPIYDTLPATISSESRVQLDLGVDMVTFTSSSTVRNWVAAGGASKKAYSVACIGPVTAAAAEELGLAPDVVATEYSTDGLVATLVDFFNKQ